MPFRSLIAALLLALWVPASAHCDLAAALQPAAEDCCPACSTAADHGRSHDSCSVVEKGDYRPDAQPLTAPAPAALVLALLPRPAAATAAPQAAAPRGETFDRDKDRLPSWNFARRTAPPARAPSSVSA